MDSCRTHGTRLCNSPCFRTPLIEMTEREKSNIIRYIHGSEDSTDTDVIYVFDELPSTVECKRFCDGNENENGNIIVVKDGVVSSVYKGSVDEVNNSLFNTYPLHKQTHPLIIERTVQRDVILKDIRVIRKILSELSRSRHRTEIKKALRGNWKQKLGTLKGIDYTAIDFSTELKNLPKKDFFKTIAFQMGQAIALHDGIELYTKRAIAEHFPELEKCLKREDEDAYIIQTLVNRFVDLLNTVPTTEIDDNTTYFPTYNSYYDINKEKRVSLN